MRELEYRGATLFQHELGGEWTLFTSVCKLTAVVEKLLNIIDKMDTLPEDDEWHCLTGRELQKDLDLHLEDLNLPPFTANSPFNP